jgi:hypothetical protein
MKKGTASNGKLLTPCIIFKGSNVMGMLIKSFSSQSTAKQVKPMEAHTGIPTRNRTIRRPMKKIKINNLVFLWDDE